KTYQEFGRNLQPDQVVVVRGRISQRDDGNSIHCYSIDTVEGTAEGAGGPLIIRINEAEATREVLEELERILHVHRGTEEVQVKLVNPDQERFFRLASTVKVSSDLFGELKVLLGNKCLS
ncbi:MAG: hypothetical protein RLZZ229_739, partial [Actinomycetota bacterium]